MTVQWTFSITTLGCKVNQYESQAIACAWQALGGVEVQLGQTDNAAPSPASKLVQHISLVNSCAITAKGERDTRSALYSIARNFPNSLRILTGCAAKLVANSLDGQDYLYDIVIPARQKYLLMQGPMQWNDVKYPHIIDEDMSATPFGEQGFSLKSFRRSRPIIKVQDGCSHRCTYCIVPLVRGPSISRKSLDILNEASALLEAGFSEILLSGINLHHYGRQMSEQEPRDFWELVELLERELAPKWAGRARFRISSLEPSQINDKALQILEHSKLLCPHLHLSLQHGSARILKSMGRGHYKLSSLNDNIVKLRKIKPNLGLGADILMGFPGEEEVDVQDTLDLIESLGLSYAHVFPYSARPGTAAVNFKNQVAHELKLEHAARVRAKVREQKISFLKSLLNEQELFVVVDNPNKDEFANKHMVYKGIDAHYASCKVELTKDTKLQGILQAKPVRLEDDALVVRV